MRQPLPNSYSPQANCPRAGYMHRVGEPRDFQIAFGGRGGSDTGQGCSVAIRSGHQRRRRPGRGQPSMQMGLRAATARQAARLTSAGKNHTKMFPTSSPLCLWHPKGQGRKCVVHKGGGVIDKPCQRQGWGKVVKSTHRRLSELNRCDSSNQFNQRGETCGLYGVPWRKWRSNLS